MTRRYIILVISLIATACVWAQQAVVGRDIPSAGSVTVVSDTTASRLLARNCFTAAPMSVIKLISKPTRLDMVDYFNAGRDTHSVNIAGGDCYITELTDDHIKFVAGTDIEMQIFVLNPEEKDKDQVIGIIETLKTPEPDSNIHFYNTKWQSLDNKIGINPTLADWVRPKAKKQLREIADAIPFVLAEYDYDPLSQTLLMFNTTEPYFAASDIPDEFSLLLSQLGYKWNGKKFKQQK